MDCDNCSRLERRIQDLEAKLAEITGTKPAVRESVTEAVTRKIPVAIPEPPPASPPAPEPAAEAETQAEPAQPAVALKGNDVDKLTALGLPEEVHADAARALQDYPRGLGVIAPLIVNKALPPAAIFHAAYAAEKYPKECVERVVTKLLPQYPLEAVDIPHACEADRAHGVDATEMAVQVGYRKRDIVCAAEVIKMWSHPRMGKDAVDKMRKLFAKVHCDIEGEDLRYCAMCYKNLGEEYLEKALRERHPKNEREPWARGLSIPLIGWAYKLSAPHTGPAIDEVRKRGSRREKLGQEVLSVLGRKFGRKVNMPAWLGGSQD